MDNQLKVFSLVQVGEQIAGGTPSSFCVGTPYTRAQKRVHVAVCDFDP